MAIVALVLWMFTAAAGVYMLISSTRIEPGEPAREEAPAVTSAAAASPTAAAATARPSARAGNVFDPPSLREAKSEPMPGLRALGEFLHPALAITGFGFWLAYTLVRNQVFAAIALGIMIGAIAAGLSWAAANARAAKREGDALRFSPRVLILHVAGATITLVLAALIAARV